MALSEHEQQMLKEIEQSLLSEDPKFGAVVTDGDFAQSKGTVTLRGGDHRNLGDWGIGWRIIFAVVLKTSYNVT